MSFSRSITTGLIALSWVVQVHAQFTIPDPQFRDWLFLVVPNAIDGDTLDIDHPDVLALDTLVVGDNCVNCVPSEPSDIAGIEYFVNLEFLRISYCLVDSVEGLPDKIRELHMDYMENLRWVEHWPDSARYISARHDYYWDGPSTLQPIPTLPPNLEYLDLYAQLLDVLPTVPPTLRELRMERNELNAVPWLPNELRHLNLRNSFLPAFPDLPDSLRYLNIGAYNQLSSLGPLPPFLEEFQCTYAPALTQLSVLPGTLRILNTIGTNIACYPFVPPTVTDWNVATALACIPNMPPFLTAGNVVGKPICNIVNSDCPVMAAATGILFLDSNGNGSLDDGEPPLPQTWATGEPGAYLGGSDLNGHYFLPLDIGTFTVTGGDVPWFTQTTAPHSVTITEPFEVDSLNHIGFQVTPGVVDLEADLFRIGRPARPGFEHRLRFKVRNVGTQVTSGTMTLQFDPIDQWVSATVAPATQAGTSAMWNFSLMQPGQELVVDITLLTPVSTAIGTELSHQGSVVAADTDVQLDNNERLFVQTVVASYDPNDKTVEPQALLPAEVLSGERVTYTIRFQNTGSFLAERVVITDTLPDGLVWNSLQFLDASHANQWFLHGRVLHVVFDGINLPDSGSNEMASHGHVRFSIQPSAGLVPGSIVLNTANIYFDFNDPVITGPSVLVAEFSTGVDAVNGDRIKVYPNPATDQVWVSCPSTVPRTYQVFAADGREVRMPGAWSNEHLLLDASQLGAGLYVIQLGGLTARFLKR
ncbi:MAG TPA: hypothetical protein PLB89_16445 [Flavobacteriales bacterium]|nr:hypothetical protein [Flavobacteriales bacterium]